jgi:hypothetical protein
MVPVLPYALARIGKLVPYDSGSKLLLERDLRLRAQAGEKKYGTVLKTGNGRDAIVDAFQELQDAVMYLQQRLLERDGELAIEYLLDQAIWLALDVADVIRKEAGNVD